MLILVNLFSGIALLMWGTYVVRTGIMRVLGSKLRHILAVGTNGKLKAFAVGMGTTALLQSSNATAMLATSFAAQGLLTSAAGLAIMLGADAGSTLMARLLTFDLSWLSPLLLSCGIPLFLSRKYKRIGQIGRALLGLGVILLALHLIVAAVEPAMTTERLGFLLTARTDDELLDAVIDVLAGSIGAILLYSSLAAVLLTATLAAAHLISIKVALYLVIGANLGSGVTALLGTRSQRPDGKRLVFGNFIFKASGAILLLPLLPECAHIFSLLGKPRDAVVNFHVFANVLRCLICLPFTDRLASALHRWIPSLIKREEGLARHLDETVLSIPPLALEQAAQEVSRMGDMAGILLARIPALMDKNDRVLAQESLSMAQEIDQLHLEIKAYLTGISRLPLSESEHERWREIVAVMVNINHASSIMRRSIKSLHDRKIKTQLAFSDEGLGELNAVHAGVMANLQLGLSVFRSRDLGFAERLLRDKAELRDMANAYAHTHFHRLSKSTPRSQETSALHLDILNDLKSMNSLFCASAYAVLNESKTRLPLFSRDMEMREG